jgi:hypothetical protein
VRVLAIAAVAAAVTPQFATAQDAPPAAFADIELERSRACVPVLARMDALNDELQPLGVRAERLRLVGEAVALEDRLIMDQLDQTDATELAVYDWFVADGRLAQAYVDTENEDMQRQRTVSREAIKGTVQLALNAIQADAQAIIDASGDIAAEAAPCDGAIFIRSAVVEACLGQESLLCTSAATTEPDGVYRFVESPNDLWDVQELRPWSEPEPLAVAPTGVLTGARSVALARHGNIVISVGFAPLIQERSTMTPEDIQQFSELLDSMGFEFDHPDVIYVPSLVVRATLPDKLAGEDQYVLHFGTIDDADIVWSSPAGSGDVVEAPSILQPYQLVRLQNGEALSLTAIATDEAGDDEAVFSLDVTTVNQATATRALLGYMAVQMVEDLKLLIPPSRGPK